MCQEDWELFSEVSSGRGGPLKFVRPPRYEQIEGKAFGLIN